MKPEAPPPPKKSRREILKTLLPFAPKRIREDPLIDKLIPKIIEDLFNIKMSRGEFAKWAALYSISSPSIPGIIKSLSELLFSRRPTEPKEYKMLEAKPDKIAKVCVVENGERRILEQATVSVNSTEGIKLYGHVLGQSSQDSPASQASPDLVIICTREPSAANRYPVLITEESQSLPEVPYFYPIEAKHIEQTPDLVGISPWAQAQAAAGKDIFVFNAGSFNPVVRAIRHVVKKDRPLQIPTPGVVTLR